MTEDAVAAIEVLRRLVTAQPDGEAAVQKVVSDALEDAGCIVETCVYVPRDVPVVGEFAAPSPYESAPRTALVGRLPGTDESCRSLLMFAHPDGEEVRDVSSWSRPVFQTTEEQGRIYGWGVADDLAGCAAAIVAIKRLASDPAPRGDLTFASTPSKRHARGVAALLHKGLSADAALYLHPAESGRGMGEIKAVSSGHLEFRITVAGQGPDTSEPSHTAFSHLAINPLEKAMVLCSGLSSFADERARRVHHPLIDQAVGRSTNLQVSSVHCGDMDVLSRLASTCVLGCAVSFPPGEKLGDVQGEIEAAVTRISATDNWLRDNPPRVEWVAGCSAAEVSQDDPLWKIASATVSGMTGQEPILNPMHTASDIRVPLIEKGIPCVGLGCLAGDLTHSGKHDEWVDRDDFLKMVDVTAQLAANWCSTVRPKV